MDDEDIQDADLAEAIRLSLLGSNNGGESSGAEVFDAWPAESPTRRHSMTTDLSRRHQNQHQQNRQVIHLQDSDEEVEPLLDSLNTGNDNSDADEDESDAMAHILEASARERARELAEADAREEEDLRLAIELSMSEASSSSSTPMGVPTTSRATTTVRTPSSNYGVTDQQATTTPSITSALPDRAALERERQERLAKRKRQTSEGDSYSSENAGAATDAKKHKPTPPIPGISAFSSYIPLGAKEPPLLGTALGGRRKSPSISRFSSASLSPSPSPAPSLSTSLRLSAQPLQTSQQQRQYHSSLAQDVYPMKYHEATFKHTFIEFSTPQQKSKSIRFSDLVNKQHLQRAVLTAMDIDQEWLRDQLPPTDQVAICVVEKWSSKDGQVAGASRPLGDKLVVVHPPQEGYGNFHAKLMILSYQTFCRIVVASGNLVPHDWEQLLNTVYIQDFPMLEVPLGDFEELNEFGSTLYDFMVKMRLPMQCMQLLLRINFDTAKVFLIPSINGTHKVGGEGAHSYGMPRLSEVIERIHADHEGEEDQGREWELEYITSSLGALNCNQIEEFSKACHGKPCAARTPLGPQAQQSLLESMRVSPRIQVVFPTWSAVQRSCLGIPGAGTVCLAPKMYNADTFPKFALRELEVVGSLSGKMPLVHSKILVARKRQILGSGTNAAAEAEWDRLEAKQRRRSSGQPGNAETSTKHKKKKRGGLAGWFYVGSHNFTESAWGIVGRKYQQTTVRGRNYELGVVCPVYEDQMTNSWQLFGPLDIPFQRPLKPHGPGDTAWTGAHA